MSDVRLDLRDQHDELAGLLASLAAGDWDRPTRCPGWTVADVVLHLAQTDEMAVASLQDRTAEFVTERMGGESAASVDDAAALMVSRERGVAPAALFDRWRQGAARMDDMFAAAGVRRRVVWVVGELSVQTLAATRLAETWIHSGDVAGAVGVELAPGERLRHVARLAWRTLPYAFARSGRELSGPVSFELTGPSGEEWSFVPEAEPATIVRGDGVELCLVAARRVDPEHTGLSAEGPDGADVLALVRTYA